jgi:hypothetical protein
MRCHNRCQAHHHTLTTATNTDRAKAIITTFPTFTVQNLVSKNPDKSFFRFFFSFYFSFFSLTFFFSIFPFFIYPKLPGRQRCSNLLLSERRFPSEGGGSSRLPMVPVNSRPRRSMESSGKSRTFLRFRSLAFLNFSLFSEEQFRSATKPSFSGSNEKKRRSPKTEAQSRKWRARQSRQ